MYVLSKTRINQYVINLRGHPLLPVLRTVMRRRMGTLTVCIGDIEIMH